MKGKTALLDIVDGWIDRVSFRFGRGADLVSEASGDALEAGQEIVTLLAGRMVLWSSRLLMPQNIESQSRFARTARISIGLPLAVGLWAAGITLIWIVSFSMAVFGARKGREYPLSENIFIWFPFLLILVGLPVLGFGDFGLGQLVVVYSLSIIVLGLNLLIGIAGQYSMGHAAFAAIGAYVTILLYTGTVFGFAMPAGIALCLGGLFSSVVGMALALPAVNVKGPYLSLVTLSLMQSIVSIIKSKPLRPYTNGLDGLSFEQPVAPVWLKSVSPALWMYYLALFYFALMFVAAHVIARRSRLGRAWLAIKDGEEKSNVLGINVPLYKSGAFALSAFYAGVGGGLIALNTGFLSATSFTVRETMDYLVVVFIGGVGTLFGSFLGGAFLAFRVFIVDFLSHAVKNGDQLLWAVYGTLLILILILAPTGIAGEFHKRVMRRNSEMPRRRTHRRYPFPDYDLDEEMLASTPDSVQELREQGPDKATPQEKPLQI